jgi:hypothetical protein
MTRLSVPRATPLFIGGLILFGLLGLFVVSEGYDASEQGARITTAMAAAAVGARVTPTEPRL